MDIIRLNVPDLVPTSIEQVKRELVGIHKIQTTAVEREFRRPIGGLVIGFPQPAVLATILKYLQDLCARTKEQSSQHNFDTDLVITGGLNGFRFIPTHGRHVVSKVPTISQQDHIRLHATIICQVLRFLRVNDEFQESSYGKAFVESIEPLVKRLRQFWKIQVTVSRARQDLDVDLGNSRVRLPASTSLIRNNLPWASFCNNTAPELDRAMAASIMSTMVRTGQDHEFRRQFLPRGAVTIIENWRQDTNEIVDAILEVNDVNEVRRLKAGRSTLHQVEYNDGRANFQLSTVLIREATLLPHVRSELSAEDRTAVAGFITRKLDRTRIIRTNGPQGQTVRILVQGKLNYKELMKTVRARNRAWRRLCDEL